MYAPQVAQDIFILKKCVVYLKYKYNWASCMLIGNPTPIKPEFQGQNASANKDF